MKRTLLIALLASMSLQINAQGLSKEAKDKIMLNNILILCEGASNISEYIYDLSLSDIVGYRVTRKTYSYKNSFGKLILDENNPYAGTLITCDFDPEKKEYRINGNIVFKENWQDSICKGNQIIMLKKSSGGTVVNIYNADGTPRETKSVVMDTFGRIVEYNDIKIGYAPNHNIDSIHKYMITTGRNFGITFLRVDNIYKYMWQGNKLISRSETEKSDQIKVSNTSTIYHETESSPEARLWTTVKTFKKNQDFEGGKQWLSTTTRHFISLEEERRLERLEVERIAEKKRQEEERVAEEKRLRLERIAEERRVEQEKYEEQRRIAEEKREKEKKRIELVRNIRESNEQITLLYMKDNLLGKALLGDVVPATMKKPIIWEAYSGIYEKYGSSDDLQLLADLIKIQENVKALANKKTKTIEKTLAGYQTPEEVIICMRDNIMEMVDK